MDDRMGKRFGLALWLALLSIWVVDGPHVAAAQDALTQAITTQIEAATYDPEVAAGVVHDAVASAPHQVADIVRAAVRTAPHLSATLTAAAVVSARDQVALIQQAAIDATPEQAHLVAIAVETAAKVVAHPERDVDIVSAALRETSGQSTTVVTAAATVCRFVSGCSPISPIPIIKAAVAAAPQAVEGIVEATVSLFPASASDVIVAATQSPVATETVRKRAESTPTESEVASGSTPPRTGAPVIVAGNPPPSGADDVGAPPAPTPTEFPITTRADGGDGSGSDGGPGTVPDLPDLPPVFPASPFF